MDESATEIIEDAISLVLNPRSTDPAYTLNVLREIGLEHKALLQDDLEGATGDLVETDLAAVCCIVGSVVLSEAIKARLEVNQG
jgi:hypothetical protein